MAAPLSFPSSFLVPVEGYPWYLAKTVSALKTQECTAASYSCAQTSACSLSYSWQFGANSMPAPSPEKQGAAQLGNGTKRASSPQVMFSMKVKENIIVKRISVSWHRHLLVFDTFLKIIGKSEFHYWGMGKNKKENPEEALLSVNGKVINALGYLFFVSSISCHAIDELMYSSKII